MIYELQQGPWAVLENFVESKKDVPSVSWLLAGFRHTPSSLSHHLWKNIRFCMKRILIVELLCFQQHTGKGSFIKSFVFLWLSAEAWNKTLSDSSNIKEKCFYKSRVLEVLVVNLPECFHDLFGYMRDFKY